MEQGLFMIALPEDTLALVQRIAQKTGMTISDVLAQGVADMARKHLTKEDFLEHQNSEVQKIRNRKSG